MEKNWKCLSDISESLLLLFIPLNGRDMLLILIKFACLTRSTGAHSILCYYIYLPFVVIKPLRELLTLAQYNGGAKVGL